MATALRVRADETDTREIMSNYQTTLRCSVSDLTEHDHFDLKTPSLCGILFSACSVVKFR
jgi:hypothetical protein